MRLCEDIGAPAGNIADRNTKILCKHPADDFIQRPVAACSNHQIMIRAVRSRKGNSLAFFRCNHCRHDISRVHENPYDGGDGLLDRFPSRDRVYDEQRLFIGTQQ